MKAKLIILMVAAIVALGTGCVTNSPGRTLATVAVTVDHAMQGWAVWVHQGNATPSQEDKVMKAYLRYQKAMATAQKAYQTYYATNDQGVITVSFAEVASCRDELISLIAELKR